MDKLSELRELESKRHGVFGMMAGSTHPRTGKLVTAERETLRLIELVENYGEVIERLEAAEAELARQRAQEPFMFGIADCDGKPYFDELCVDADGGLLADVVDSLNEVVEASDVENETCYSVVALYTTPPAIAAAGVIKWIACSERMPKEGGLYLCFAQDDFEFDINFMLFEYLKSHQKFDTAGINITHWMPLPAAPAPGGDDD